MARSLNIVSASFSVSCSLVSQPENGRTPSNSKQTLAPSIQLAGLPVDGIPLVLVPDDERDRVVLRRRRRVARQVGDAARQRRGLPHRDGLCNREREDAVLIAEVGIMGRNYYQRMYVRVLQTPDRPTMDAFYMPEQTSCAGHESSEDGVISE